MHDVIVSLPGATGTLLVVAMVSILKSPILEASVGFGGEKLFVRVSINQEMCWNGYSQDRFGRDGSGIE